MLPAIGHCRLNSVTKADCRLLVAELVTRGKGAPTIQGVVRLLHRIFEVSLEEERITKNPVHGVSVPKMKRRQPRFLSADEVARIAALVPLRFRALVYFLAYTGCRIGEASALSVRNLDLGESVVRIVESSPEVRGKKIHGDPKTRKVRVVHLGPQLQQILKDHVTKYGRPLDPNAFVFTGEREAQIRQNAFRSRVFQPAARKAGIAPPIPTVHDLRHTAASLMAKAGYSLREAQEELGHSHATMTALYTHLFPNDADARVRRLDSFLQPPEQEGPGISG
jgi:integrase